MSRAKKRASQPPTKPASARRRGPPRSAERRGQLLGAAHEAILEHGPNVTIEQVAAQAGVARTIVYRHFGNRHGLAQAIIDETFGGASTSPGPAAKPGTFGVRDMFRHSIGSCETPEDFHRLLSTWMFSFLTFVDWNPSLYVFLQEEGVLGRLWDGSRADDDGDGFERWLASSLRNVLEARGLDTSAVQTWTDALTGIATGVARRRVADRTLGSSAVQNQVVELVWNGLGELLSREAAPRRKKQAKSKTRARRASKPQSGKGRR